MSRRCHPFLICIRTMRRALMHYRRKWQEKHGKRRVKKTCVQWWWSTCTYACPCLLGLNYRFIVHPHRKAWNQPYIRGSWTCMSVISHYWYHMTVYDHVYTRPSLAQKNLEHFFFGPSKRAEKMKRAEIKWYTFFCTKGRSRIYNIHMENWRTW